MKIKLTKRAFTLIELLAVIIILAIVALIATPLILNVINDSKRSANLSEAYLILSGAENAYLYTMLDSETLVPDSVEANIIDGIEKGENVYEHILTSGEKPPKGDIKIKPNGDIALAIYNEGVCYLKGYEENIITPDETVSEADCVAPSSDTVVLDPLDPANPDYCANYTEKYKDYLSMQNVAEVYGRPYWENPESGNQELTPLGTFEGGAMATASYVDEEGGFIDQEIVVPCEVGGVTVTTLHYNFFNESSASGLIIPETVVEIRQGAFIGNSFITSVTIPSSVMTIGGNMFVDRYADPEFAPVYVTEIIVEGKSGPEDFTSLGDNWHGGATVTYQP